MTTSEIKQKTTCFVMVTHRIIKEDDIFVANCPELGISSQGDTIEEADDHLKEAVSCYQTQLKA